MSPLILHELSYAFPRYIKQMTHQDIANYLLMVLGWEAVQGEKGAMVDAVERWRDTSGLAFADAYLAALAAEQDRPVYSKNLRELRAQGYSADRIRLTRMADLKVLGQTYELLLPLPVQNRKLDAAGMKALLAAFGKLYRARYAFFYEGEPIEIVNLRLSAEGLNAPVKLPQTAKAKPNPAAARRGRRPVYFEGRGFVPSTIYEREELRFGMRIRGPAVIEEATSATLIPPGYAAEAGADLGLFVRLKSAKETRR